MIRVKLHTQAPDFTLPDFLGHHISLLDYLSRKHVLVVLNRGLL